MCTVCFSGLQAVPVAAIAGRYWYVNRRRRSERAWGNEHPEMTPARSQADQGEGDGVSGRGPTVDDRPVAISATSTR